MLNYVLNKFCTLNNKINYIISNNKVIINILYCTYVCEFLFLCTSLEIIIIYEFIYIN